MKTRYEQMTAGAIDGYNNFVGDDSDYRDWYGVAGRSRDSGALEESNFAAALELLGGESNDVRVERYGHWAVGWIEEIYVRPGTDSERIAREIEARLENYPVLNEEDFRRREQNAAEEVWKHCYTPKQRIAYIRAHEHQFDNWHNWRDVRAEVSGEQFTGYACDLIG